MLSTNASVHNAWEKNMQDFLTSDLHRKNRLIAGGVAVAVWLLIALFSTAGAFGLLLGGVLGYFGRHLFDDAKKAMSQDIAPPTTVQPPTTSVTPLRRPDPPHDAA